ncbi:hypothetical protein [Actinocrispum wychmicini]|uniref:hypothetical protein n=1 Tax=Actinocrispum wychmicini TaxID=1213861 RepID=UPI001A9E5A9D|nr:hypothetical protein [Actinocrispum wychmicini]
MARERQPRGYQRTPHLRLIVSCALAALVVTLVAVVVNFGPNTTPTLPTLPAGGPSGIPRLPSGYPSGLPRPPSGYPTRPPSGFPTSLPSGFPTAPPPGFPTD